MVFGPFALTITAYIVKTFAKRANFKLILGK